MAGRDGRLEGNLGQKRIIACLEDIKALLGSASIDVEKGPLYCSTATNTWSCDIITFTDGVETGRIVSDTGIDCSEPAPQDPEIEAVELCVDGLKVVQFYQVMFVNNTPQPAVAIGDPINTGVQCNEAKLIGQVCVGQYTYEGEPQALVGLNGTLAGGTTYDITGGNAGTVEIGDVGGDLGWRGTMQYATSLPVKVIVTSISSSNIGNPITWTKQTGPANPLVASTQITTNGAPIVYTPGADFDVQPFVVNPNQLQASLPNSSGVTAADLWGDFVSEDVTSMALRARDKDGMNVSFIEAALDGSNPTTLDKFLLSDGSYEYRDSSGVVAIYDPALEVACPVSIANPDALADAIAAKTCTIKNKKCYEQAKSLFDTFQYQESAGTTVSAEFPIIVEDAETGAFPAGSIVHSLSLWIDNQASVVDTIEARINGVVVSAPFDAAIALHPYEVPLLAPFDASGLASFSVTITGVGGAGFGNLNWTSSAEDAFDQGADIYYGGGGAGNPRIGIRGDGTESLCEVFFSNGTSQAFDALGNEITSIPNSATAVPCDEGGPVKIDDSTPIRVEVTNPQPIIAVDTDYVCNADTGVYDQIVTVTTNGVAAVPVTTATTIACDADAPSDYEVTRECGSDGFYHIVTRSFDAVGVETIVSDVATTQLCAEPNLTEVGRLCYEQEVTPTTTLDIQGSGASGGNAGMAYFNADSPDFEWTATQSGAFGAMAARFITVGTAPVTITATNTATGESVTYTGSPASVPLNVATANVLFTTDLPYSTGDLITFDLQFSDVTGYQWRNSDATNPSNNTFSWSRAGQINEAGSNLFVVTGRDSNAFTEIKFSDGSSKFYDANFDEVPALPVDAVKVDCAKCGEECNQDLADKIAEALREPKLIETNCYELAGAAWTEFNRTGNANNQYNDGELIDQNDPDYTRVMVNGGLINQIGIRPENPAAVSHYVDVTITSTAGSETQRINVPSGHGVGSFGAPLLSSFPNLVVVSGETVAINFEIEDGAPDDPGGFRLYTNPNADMTPQGTLPPVGAGTSTNVSFTIQGTVGVTTYTELVYDIGDPVITDENGDTVAAIPVGAVAVDCPVVSTCDTECNQDLADRISENLRATPLAVEVTNHQPQIDTEISYLCNVATGVYDQYVVVTTDGVVAPAVITPTLVACDADTAPDFETVRVCSAAGFIHIVTTSYTEDGTPTILSDVATGETCLGQLKQEVARMAMVASGTSFTVPTDAVSVTITAQSGSFDVTNGVDTMTGRVGSRSWGQGTIEALTNSGDIVVTSNGDVDVIWEACLPAGPVPAFTFKTDPITLSNSSTTTRTFTPTVTGVYEAAYVSGTVGGSSTKAWGFTIGETPSSNNVFNGGGFPAGRMIIGNTQYAPDDVYPKVPAGADSMTLTAGTEYTMLIYTESGSTVTNGCVEVRPV